jgi:sulfoxide reductase heme-binding subunit YedZ
MKVTMELSRLQKYIEKLPFTPLQMAMHAYAWSELVLLVFDFFNHRLTANPIQALEQRTGLHAITLLVLSLACTPLNTLLGWRELLKRRRALGLYAFMYAAIHISIFVFLDYGLMWSLLLQAFTQKPYIIYGLITFLVLLPLAITSFNIWKVRLGKNWKRLHQAVYFIAPLAALHFALSVKGDIFRLQGNIARPAIYAAVILVLLILRVSFIRKHLVSLRNQVQSVLNAYLRKFSIT